ncbi:helix-turn-helix transcriptional regulator [Pelagerythrobacter aerophilus]|uniref:helix-turn-helix transcriptional regulator n=1 Tax=Pelagerythrobacter aerophilus TaxID=2306995 RepID=UPI0015FFC2DC|nr:LuxR C-terminal-related transcriptional regulator [Pelagerythrobacter aerophilus]
MGFDVGLYVAPETRGVLAAQDADLLKGVGAHNWLVLSDQRDNPIYTRLMRDQMPACAVPLEVSRRELPHLVVLATRSRRFCIRAHCDACPSSPVQSTVGATLNDQQWQLMRYLSEGLSNKEIARIERCTESNVKVRVRGLLDRIHVTNRTQAAVMAARAGLSYDRRQGSQAY